MNKRTEIEIAYDPVEYEFYRADDDSVRRRSAFYDVRWPDHLRRGRGRSGEFPIVVAREHYRLLGYKVLASEPLLPNQEGFILVAYPRKRRAGDAAYRRMEAMFGPAILAALNLRADTAKRRATRSAGGGDPDLFVYRDGDPSDRFFVEVKHRYQITTKQEVTFPLIEEMLCPVRVARLVAARMPKTPPNKRMKLAGRAKPSG